MSLLRWYNPMVIRLALMAISVAISIASGGGIVAADGEDWSGP